MNANRHRSSRRLRLRQPCRRSGLVGATIGTNLYAYDAENRMLSARPTAPSEGDLAVVNAYDHKHRRIMKRVERFDGEAWQTSETHTFLHAFGGGRRGLHAHADARSAPPGSHNVIQYAHEIVE